MHKPDLSGITVATVLPFDADLAIDWQSYARVLDYCAMPEGIAAVFVNGHAGEGSLLTGDERREVIERTRAHVRGKPLLAGIIAHSTAEAIEEARMAKAAGADCAVLFPPSSLGGGAANTPAAPVAFAKAVSEEADIPVSIFQFPIASGYGFSTETLVALAGLPGVVAVKEGSDTIMAYEDNWRAVKVANAQVQILPSNYNWFLPQLAIGADGILSGLVSLVPHLFADLWKATVAEDLSEMRRVYDRLHPIVRSIYGASPLIDMHTRIKAGLKDLGIIEHASPRPPLMPLRPEIAAAVEKTVQAARAAGDIVVG